MFSREVHISDVYRFWCRKVIVRQAMRMITVRNMKTESAWLSLQCELSFFGFAICHQQSVIPSCVSHPPLSKLIGLSFWTKYSGSVLLQSVPLILYAKMIPPATLIRRRKASIPAPIMPCNSSTQAEAMPMKAPSTVMPPTNAA